MDRHSLSKNGQIFFHPRQPLFQFSPGHQLTQRQVLEFLRRALKAVGEDSMSFGTHSFRIGGFNRLFHMGVPIEVIKRLGGWSSDAWREYLRVYQKNCLIVSSRMTRRD